MNIKYPIYLDNHATTKVDPEVLEAMLPYFTEIYGNASSKNHKFGSDASEGVEKARSQVAKGIKAKDSEIIFTSGATESINLATKGVAEYFKNKNPHFITVATEHKATLDCHEWLEKNGFEVTILGVNHEGFIDLGKLRESIKDNTKLVSIMTANNEIGTIQPIADIGAICRESGCYFMTDATQAIGKLEIDVESMNIDLLAGSGHKIHGPKGIGFLYVRRSNPHVYLTEQINGGKHERSMRSGTLNVPGIIGLGIAIEISTRNIKANNQYLKELRDMLEDNLLQNIPGSQVNGPGKKNRLSNNLNIYLPGVEAEALIISLSDKISFSTGSACTTASISPSHVLEAINTNEDVPYKSIRLSISKNNSIHDIKNCKELISNQYLSLIQVH